jgi:shikimate 5-dehydrogenase
MAGWGSGEVGGAGGAAKAAATSAKQSKVKTVGFLMLDPRIGRLSLKYRSAHLTVDRAFGQAALEER